MKLLPYLVVFIAGGSIMVLELVGSRILAPYLGTSIYVWTSLIGVILACLSLGYWLGGKIADQRPSYSFLSWVILFAAFAVGAIPLFQDNFLKFLGKNIVDLRLASVLAGALLFGPGSILLAMVSPFVARLELKEVKHSGQTVGRLSAVSTVGSIVGTFFAGFVLIAYFDNIQILLLLAVLLSILVLLINVNRLSKKLFFSFFLLFFFLYFSLNLAYFQRGQFVAFYDSAYQSLLVYDVKLQNGTVARVLRTDPFAVQGAKILGQDGLLFDYLKFFDIYENFNKNSKHFLVLGAGVYSYPEHLAEKVPEAKIDVVEIDPAVTKISQDLFQLQDSNQISIYHEDARTFVNRNEKTYDVIFLDAFHSNTVPYQLTTKEFLTKIRNSLTTNGVLVTNIISAIEGDKGKFIRASTLTYRQVFKNAFLFQVRPQTPSNQVQNLILVGTKNDTPTWVLENFEANLWNKQIQEDVSVLTDNYAPVDNYLLALFNDKRNETYP